MDEVPKRITPLGCLLWFTAAVMLLLSLTAAWILGRVTGLPPEEVPPKVERQIPWLWQVCIGCGIIGFLLILWSTIVMRNQRRHAATLAALARSAERRQTPR